MSLFSARVLTSSGPQRLGGQQDRRPEQHAIFSQELPLQRERWKPVVFLQDPGIVRRKLRVLRNIAVAPRLPSAEALGESGLAAMSTPRAISVIPMSPAVFRAPILLLIHEKSGLVETMGFIFSASYSANFSAPTNNRVPASP